MDIFDAIHKRTSVRSYKPEKVPHELINKLMDAARWAPSSCNLQLTEYIIVDDKDLIKELAKKVTGKFNWAETYIIFLYDPRFTVKRSAAVTSLGAAMENILLAATGLGLSCCPMAGFERDASLKKLLNIPDWYEAALIMSVGYAAESGEAKHRARIPNESIVHWQKFTPHTALKDSRNLSEWDLTDSVNYRQRLAPVYLYNHHFRLQTFAPAVYESALQKAREHLTGSVLDLVSYDGAFVKALHESNTTINITVSDYFEYPLQVLKDAFFGIKTLTIDHENTTDAPDASYDAVTIVHKLEFTPEWQKLVEEAVRVLKPGGTLFISTTNETLKKRFLQWAKVWKKKLVDWELVNVYENSPYYKIGPMQNRVPSEITSTAQVLGCEKIADGKESVAKTGAVPHVYYWAVYKKS